MVDFVSLTPLWWLAAIGLLAVGMRYSLVDRPRALSWASLAFRAASIVFLILALCRPFVGDESDELHIIYLGRIAVGRAGQAVAGAR
jgi:hypothetical protein